MSRFNDRNSDPTVNSAEQPYSTEQSRFSSEMRLFSLESVLRAAWRRDTSSDPSNWSEENPAWGQCAVTACAIQDILGGEIIWAEASLPDGSTVSHYFNKLDSELDLTRQQFPEGTVIPVGVPKERGFASTRDYVLSFEATRTRYELLKSHIKDNLLSS